MFLIVHLISMKIDITFMSLPPDEKSSGDDMFMSTDEIKPWQFSADLGCVHSRQHSWKKSWAWWYFLAVIYIVKGYSFPWNHSSLSESNLNWTSSLFVNIAAYGRPFGCVIPEGFCAYFIVPHFVINQLHESLWKHFQSSLKEDLRRKWVEKVNYLIVGNVRGLKRQVRVLPLFSAQFYEQSL